MIWTLGKGEFSPLSEGKAQEVQDDGHSWSNAVSWDNQQPSQGFKPSQVNTQE